MVAKKQGTMVLVDPSNPLVPNAEIAFFKKLASANQNLCINIFGGTVVVPEQLATNIHTLVNSLPIIDNPITKGSYTLSSEKTPNSSIQFTGTFDKNVQWIDIKIDGNGKSSTFLIKPVNCIVDRTIYLSQGPGKYTIWILTSTDPKGPYNIDYVGKIHFDNIQNIDQRDMNYLLPTSLVESDSSEIIELANDITKGLQTDMEKTKAIHNWIAKNIAYDADAFFSGTNSSMGALETLHNNKGVCNSYSELNAALHRAVGIRAKVISGVALGFGLPKNWNEVDNQS